MSLKYLALIECGIGDLAMIEIAKGISEAICLEYVDISHNKSYRVNDVNFGKFKRHNHFEQAGYTALI